MLFQLLLQFVMLTFFNWPIILTAKIVHQTENKGFNNVLFSSVGSLEDDQTLNYVEKCRFELNTWMITKNQKKGGAPLP